MKTAENRRMPAYKTAMLGVCHLFYYNYDKPIILMATATFRPLVMFLLQKLKFEK